MSGQAIAFEIDTNNPDVQMRWDNTLRYNWAQRVGHRDKKIAAAPNFDEGNYLFDKGDTVSSRLDVLSELDFVYKKNMGFRVSAALWYDDAYGDKGKSNPAIANPSYINNEFSPFVKRYYHGPSGEFLDAFAFTNFNAGDVPIKLKVGQHTVTWGEGLFLGGAMHGVSYSQAPLDLQKGFATPGVEAKELFRPLDQISAQAQITDKLSIAAEYFLDWQPFRYPEGGTFLGPVDFAFNGPDRVVVAQLPNIAPLGPYAGALIGAKRGNAATPERSGEYGLAARWSPEMLDGTMGFYYRRFADKMPQLLLTNIALTPAAFPASISNLPLVTGSTYNLIYADHIDLYGISLAKNIAGVSFGAELSYRRNTPLTSKVLGVALGLPSKGDTKGPRGDTYHGLVNALGTIASTPLFDAAIWATELTWSRWNKVRSGANLFNAVGFAGCSTLTGAPLGKDSGCATKNYVGIAAAFTPTWYQVMPGYDLSMPLTYSVGLNGNAATTFGGNDGLGSFSVGLGLDIRLKYKVDLKYSGYMGNYQTNAAGTQVVSQNGFTTLLKDRDFLSLTFKTSF
nr:DUF1302 domain-containing protein [Georgfuchsia toluolica]